MQFRCSENGHLFKASLSRSLDVDESEIEMMHFSCIATKVSGVCVLLGAYDRLRRLFRAVDSDRRVSVGTRYYFEQ